MKAVTILPESYREIYSVNLQKDKKRMLLINLLATVIAVIMVLSANAYVPFWSLLDMSQGIVAYFVRFGVLLVGMVGYLILHELVHGIAMKCYGTKKVKYGFTGIYAFAASEDYYSKKAYIVIALAPIVVWGVVLLVINCFVPVQWFWVVYFIQVCNISGAAGDLYVTWKFIKMPKDILIRDFGVGMNVYSESECF